MTSLAERLGYPAEQRILIVNCDDIGSSHACNVAAERAMRQGWATSATLMVPCPWAREAARMAAGTDLGVGVHLTLTCEYPGYRWRALTGAKSLHDDDGFMPATAGEVFARADTEEVFFELQAQIDQAIAWGVNPTHLDSHMGTVQTEARLFDVYLGLAEKYDLPLRMPGRSLDARQGFDGWTRTAERGLLHNENWISPWPRDTREVIEQRIPILLGGVSEIYAHPVDDGPELRGYDPDHPDIRANDAVVLSDPAIRALIDGAGVTKISYAPLRELQRAERRAA
jgi:hypothetical protein